MHLGKTYLLKNATQKIIGRECLVRAVLWVKGFVLSDIAISGELQIKKFYVENWELTKVLSCVTTNYETGPDAPGTVYLNRN